MHQEPESETGTLFFKSVEKCWYSALTAKVQNKQFLYEILTEPRIRLVSIGFHWFHTFYVILLILKLWTDYSWKSP